MEDLIITGRGAARLGAKQKKSHVNVFRNVYVRLDALEPDAPFWVSGQRGAEARVLAANVIAPPQGGDPRPFAHQSAMIASGLSPVNHNPTVTRRGSVGATRLLSMPSIKVGSVTLNSVPLRVSQVDVGSRVPRMVTSGLYRDSLECAAVDIARTSDGFDSIADASKILRHLVGFERGAIVETRERESVIRRQLLRINEEMPSPWNRAKARAILTLADCGSESPGEARLKWMVANALVNAEERGIVLETQHRVSARWFGSYFLDIALFPDRIAIEFDGMSKLVSNNGNLNARVEEEKIREDDIRALGWRFLRINSKDMRSRYGCIRKVVALLNDMGVPAEVPSGW